MTTNKPPYGATCTDQQHETHVLSKHGSHTKTNQMSGCEDRSSARPVFPASSGATYADRDHMALGDYYLRHVSAMTGEALHAKSAIAAELAHRDREIDRQHAELETLRMGYNAARLEIESLRAAQPAGAPQPGTAYAALPDDRESFKTYLKECDECAIVPDVAGAFNAAWQIASHAQAPAQSEVVPECHYGPLRDSDAEWGKQLSVYATLPRAADTQQAPAQAAPVDAIASILNEVMEIAVSNGANSVSMPDHYVEVAAWLAAAPTTQPAPKQDPSQTAVQLAELVLSDCGHSSRYAPLLNRVTARINAHVERRLDELRGCLESRPSPVAQGDALDAARYRFLAAHCRSTSEHWDGRWSIIVDGPEPKSHDSEDDFDASIDAARKEKS